MDMDSTNFNSSLGCSTGSNASSAASSRSSSPETNETPLSNSQPSTSTSQPLQPSTSQLSNGKKKPSKSTNRMVWNNTSENILVAEVVYAHPYQYRVRTTERTRAWQQVAEAMQRQGYKVDARAVRDHINVLKTSVKAKNNLERAATGIAVEETDQEKRIREAVEQMIQEEEDIEMAPKEKGDEEKKKADGAEMRKRACETFGETRKRHQSDSGASTSTTPRRLRNSGRETMAIVERRMEMDQENKREEKERRREEEERRRVEEERRRVEEEKRQAEEALRERRYEMMQQQMVQQQQQQLQQQQQNQQQNQQMLSMMMVLIKSLDKKN